LNGENNREHYLEKSGGLNWKKTHRNLSSRMSILALVQQTFLGKKKLVKSLDIHPRQGILLQRNILQGSTKPLFTTQTT
jgi:hypothetical protein